MTALVWDDITSRDYQQGVDRGVLYPPDGSAGIIWNGLISAAETEETASNTLVYLDGLAYFTDRVSGDFGLAVTAYTYPVELDSSRAIFGMSYRTQKVNGYTLHLVYNGLASPVTIERSSETADADAENFDFQISTVPVKIPGGYPTAHLIIDSTLADPVNLASLETMLYGTDDADGYLPAVQDIIDLFNENAILFITDNGDGTWTAEGPDDLVFMTDSTTFEIIASSVIFLGDDTYRISTY